MKIDVYTLAIDGSTYDGSVAVLLGSKVVAERTLKREEGAVARAERADKLMPAIVECLAEARIRREGIERIICGSGPGSFTSLRVAASVAKGLAVGLGVSLYAVPSLALSVTGVQPPLPSGEYLSVLDAMRGDFHAARVTKPLWPTPGSPRPLTPADPTSIFLDPRTIEVGPSTIISRAQLDELRIHRSATRIVGPGQEVDAHPRARGAAPIYEWIVRRGPVDLASWEPDYGRLAEAQVRWEAAHGRKLTT